MSASALWKDVPVKIRERGLLQAVLAPYAKIRVLHRLVRKGQRFADNRLCVIHEACSMKGNPTMTWSNLTNIGSTQYTCGWCSNLVGTPVGFYDQKGVGGRIHICPHCEKPTVFSERQVPGVAYGAPVEHLPADISSLYQEARQSTSASCYTGAVLICRKLLMNIAVSQGAKEGGTFISYVEYLADNGYVPPNGKGWVDHIRKKGNEATHEIVLMTNGDAKELISFVEMLLKFIYEFPSRVPTPVSP